MSFTDYTNAKLRGEKKKTQTFTEYTKKKLNLDDDDISPVVVKTVTNVKNSDIAPVKKEEDNWYDGWFKKSEGTTTDAVKSTGTDILTQLLTGISGMGETVLDTLAYLRAPSYNTYEMQNGGFLTSEDHKVADVIRKESEEFIKKDLYDEKEVAKNIVAGTGSLFAGKSQADVKKYLDNDMERYSIIGDKTRGVVQSAGQLGATALLSPVIPWYVTTGMTSFGGGLDNALNQGATFEEAGQSALITAGAEILTEKLSGGISFGSKTADDAIMTALSKGISNKGLRALSKVGVDIAGEGSEEVISEFFGKLGSSLYKEEDLKEILASEEAVDDYITSFISGGVLGGVSSAKNVGKSAYKGTDVLTGYSQNEQTIFNKVLENRIQEQEKQTGKKLTSKEKSKVYDEVQNAFERGEIEIDEIENILGGETLSKYNSLVEQEDSLTKKLKELGSAPNTVENAKQYESIDSQLKELKSKNEKAQLKSQLSKEVFDMVKSDARIQESYTQRAKRGQDFTADVSKYDAKSRETIQRAIDSGILNDTRKTHEFVDLVAKLSAEKGVSFDFLNNQKLRESGFVLEGKTINGFKRGNDIVINMESKNALNTVVGHEITHVLEGSPELFSALSESAKDFAETKGIYQSMYDTAFESYKDVYNDMTEEEYAKAIEKEVTADLVAEYVFSDIDFIRGLSTKNRNVFQKVYDEIKYFIKSVKAGSDAEKKLLKVKKMFEEVYRENSEVDEHSNDGVKYSLTDNKGRRLTKEQQEFFKDSKVRDEDGNLLEVYHGAKTKGVNVFEYSKDRQTGTDYGKAYYFTSDFVKASGYSYDASKDARVQEYQKERQRLIDKFLETKDKEVLQEFKNVKVDGKTLEELLNDETYDTGGEVKKVYLNLTNPLIVDAEGKYYYEVYDTYFEEAKANGNDGIIVKNVIDNPRGEQRPIDVYIAFENNQMKNIDNVGPTSSNDIRFSLSKDSEGNELTENQKEYFKDSKIVDDNGNLKVMYHGTGDDFTVFNPMLQGGKNGTAEGYGLYFSDNTDVTDAYGKRQLKGYLNMKRPASSDAKTIKASELEKLIKATCQKEAQKFVDDGDYDTIDEAIRDTWISNYVDTYSSSITKAYKDVAKDILRMNDNDMNIVQEVMSGMAIRDYESAYEFYDTLKQTIGVDGFLTEWDNPDNPDKPSKIAVVFDSNQFKNIDNLNPTENPDIRYSVSQDTEGKQLSPEQSEYFKDSKVRDENGVLKVMYHGTEKGGFHEFIKDFTDDGTSFFFTDNNETAKSYSGTHENYSAQTLRTADDFNKFFENINADEYEVREENGQFVLYEDGEEVATSDTSNGIYEEFRDWTGIGYGSANYKVYLNLTNPLIVDAKGNNWNELEIADYDYDQETVDVYDFYVEETGFDLERNLPKFTVEARTSERTYNEEMYEEDIYREFGKTFAKDLVEKAKDDFEGYSIWKKRRINKDTSTNIPSKTRDIVQYAKERGYDGVIFKNIVDNGLYASGIERFNPSTVAVAFEPNQIKSVDNAKPTTNEDIRYSISEDTEETDAWLDGLSIDSLMDELLLMEFDDFDDFDTDFAPSNNVPVEKKRAKRRVDEVNKRLKKIGLSFNGTKSASWTDERIEKYLDGSHYGSSTPNYAQAYITYMSPQQFLNLTVGGKTSTLDMIENESAEYGEIDFEKLGNDSPVRLYIEEGKNGAKVTGHEGRHRMYLLGKAGFEKIPVLMFDYKTKYNKSYKESMKLTTQKFNDEDFISKSRDVVAMDVVPFSQGNRDLIIDKFGSGNTDADIHYSISDENQSFAPMRQGTYSKDVLLENLVQDEVTDAPVQQNAFADDYAPLTETEANMRDDRQIDEHYFPDDIPVETEREEGYNGNYADHITPSDPFYEKDIFEVGKDRKQKAYMYENPEVKPFFQQEARYMMGELDKSTKGERLYNDQLYYDTNGEQGFFGTRRHTSEEIAYLLDTFGYTYKDIAKGLNAIIEDNGKENNAISKRIEFLLDERLRLGYTDFMFGDKIPPNQEYINLLNEKQINEYNDEAFGAWVQNLSEEDIKYFTQREDDIAPVSNEYAPVGVENAQVDKTSGVPLYDAKPRRGVVEGQQSMFDEPDTPKTVTRSALHSGIMNNIKTTFKNRGFNFDDVLKKAKNLSTFSTVDNTPQRVMEKALGYKEGQVLGDLTVNKVAQNETEGIKWLNSFTDRRNGLLAQLSKQYNIKSGSKESAAAQMYAEGFYVNEANEIISYGDRELSIDFPDARVRENIKGLANDPRIRQIYDDTLRMINESRTRNAYPEIPRLDNYFLHFRAMDDTFSRLGLPFNPNDIRAKDLPTDLNGVTADLKPGQPYFASAMHRTGKRTSFDLLGGMERYLTSAKNQIYHIDDIQTLRALRNYIADTYGQAQGLENLDALTEEEAQIRIEQVYNSHLSTFAKFLNEEANVLAGKTALIDRGIEGIFGRRAMQFMNTLNQQVGSNMVGYSASSALVNIDAIPRAIAKTNKADFVKGFAQFASNKIGSVFGRNDGFAEQSPVMIRRKGAERFYRTPYQKVADTGYVLMGAVDNAATEIIARTKYNELLRKGMDSQKAHFETDKWVSRLMGDRSLGQMPQLFNSKTLGLITKFQLEVRNNLDSMFYDTIQESKVSNEEIQNALSKNARTAAKATSTIVQLAVGQHLFGKAMESVVGYNPSFDIISVLMTALGFDDDEESEDTVLDNIEQGFLELVEDLPYASTFTGGRIPISSALPIQELVSGKDEYGNDKSRLETLGEIAPYYVMPAGYGQIKKTQQGLSMFDEDLPVSGSYTDSGNLRFPVEDTLKNRVQAGLFGQYANEYARDYFDNERDTLKKKQIQEYKDLELPIREYWDYQDGLKKQDTLEDKFEYINDLDVSVEQKNIMINNVLNRKEKVDMSNYDDFSNYDEFDWYTKNTEKYNYFEEYGVSVSDYLKADDDTKDAIDADYRVYKEYPEKVTLSKAISSNWIEYRGYYKDLYDIRADKDANGNSISGTAKAKKMAYIENLNLDAGQKAILHRICYDGKADKNLYNPQIVEYLDNRNDISYAEMVTILEELGMKVHPDGRVTW